MIGRLNDREIGKFNHSLAQSFNLAATLCVLRVLCELCEFGEFGEFGSESACFVVGEGVCVTASCVTQ